MIQNRKKLNLDSQHKVLDFILRMADITDEYVIEDYNGHLRVEARSITGVLYASRDFEEIYLKNCTKPGVFPDFIKNFED